MVRTASVLSVLADGDALLDSIAGDASPRMKLDFKLFKGVSVQFNDLDKAEESAAAIAALPAVKSIWPQRLYQMPKPTVHQILGDGTDIAAATATKRQFENDTFSTHVMTQVDKLRAEGNVGTGIKVAVIDTGVDYRHPALGGCFGPECLVTFGYDLVGDDFDGFNTPVPDPDPFDCGGHGSHVAGIIAAQTNNPFGIIGAATGVTLGSFRVFGCDGSTPDDVLISAYNMAYEAGADIITASIGGPSGWTEDPWAVAVQRIVENGVPCTISAGNDGDAGLFYASTAANGKKVTAIASIDNTHVPTLFNNGTYTVDGGANTSFGFTAGSPANWGGVTLPLWSVNFNTADPANACEALPADTPDLSGYVVLVRRGTCTFVTKLANVAAKGAKYVIFYNNVPAGTVSVSGTGVPGIEAVAMVEASLGATWITALAAGSEVVVSLVDPITGPKFLVDQVNTATGGFLSTYTSWGPTYEADLKPQLATPGGLILSTYPTALGSYAVLSGTSMACPLAAGIYALIMVARGTKDPKTIENILSATANPNLFNDGASTYPVLAPVAQQGSGLLQAYDAAYATTLLSVSSLAYNDTDNFVAVQNFSISNEGKAAVTYTLSNIGAATGYTFEDDTTIFPATFPNELTDDFATLVFGPSSTVTIPAGQRRIISVTATPPVGLDALRLPVWSGYIAINGTDGSSLSLPYQGVTGSLHSRTVLDPNNTYLSSDADDYGTPEDVDFDALPPVPANTTFILPPPGHANDTKYENSTVLPLLVVNLAFGSPLLLADVVPISTCKPVETKTNLGITTLGQAYSFPHQYEPRAAQKSIWDGRLADGTYAPSGVYKFVVRALHVYGNPSDPAEYDVVQTVPFRIRYIGANSTATALERVKRL
ncbi:putative minor extracellular protease vpr protein [Phaeoacremonium minimum UCRPA7]|uniref:Putative minor extracellular protease vpr protein n=1 Tax=Phaeoacremonium minimum (strain UCR-PA7) TaxID=1286976 RepID=R8BKH5_PHAM7|nr:putative minor extracellular protease vpr protein [Phaeoacremonium minimum UCRPA7]EON99722.1 putative minor extracellular protease vpr protein [Phaeoacremonium minimum UCRPA7]